MQSQETDGRLVVKGEIAVDGGKYPHLRRALERGRRLLMNGPAACATGQGIETKTEDAMAKKSVAKSVKGAKKAPQVREPKTPRAAKAPKERDPRLPSPGTTFTRDYKGKTLEVKALEAGFEFKGEQFPSLTALALKITGAKAISGPRFFNLDKPKTEATAK